MRLIYQLIIKSSRDAPVNQTPDMKSTLPGGRVAVSNSCSSVQLSGMEDYQMPRERPACFTSTPMYD